MAPAPTSQYSRGSLRLPITGTIAADEHFLDNLVPPAARIVAEFAIGLLAVRANDDNVGPRTVGVLPGAPAQDHAMTWGARRHNALTQLTAVHESEPMQIPSGGSGPKG